MRSWAAHPLRPAGDLVVRGYQVTGGVVGVDGGLLRVDVPDGLDLVARGAHLAKLGLRALALVPRPVVVCKDPVGVAAGVAEVVVRKLGVRVDGEADLRNGRDAVDQVGGGRGGVGIGTVAVVRPRATADEQLSTNLLGAHGGRERERCDQQPQLPQRDRRHARAGLNTHTPHPHTLRALTLLPLVRGSYA